MSSLKYFVNALTILAGACASAGVNKQNQIVCVDESVQDATYAASFTNAFGDGATVRLSVPVGESGTRYLTGNCIQDSSYNALAMICMVADPETQGYTVTLSPKNQQGELKATYNRVSESIEHTLANCREL